MKRGGRHSATRTFAAWCALTAAVLLLGLDVARADDPGPSVNTPPITEDGIPDPSIATSLPPAIGGLGGARKALVEQFGVQFGVNYIGEVLGNTTGGTKRGAIYEGRLELVVDADLNKTLGIKGLEFHANAFQIHGRGLSRYNIGDIEPASNIEATRATRLFELWLDQSLFDNKMSIRFGQLGADTEFITSSWAGLFINGTFGWPTITALNLPSGGPAYPLATPAVRVRFDPNPNFSFFAAIFNGDPAGPAGPGKDIDPQVRNNDGLRFRLKDTPFTIAEVQGKYEVAGLAGTIKIGAWHHFARFNDLRFGTDLLSLADSTNTNGTPISRRGNNGIYGVIDQQVFAPKDSANAKGVGVFVRASASPGDRNLVNFYIDGGINFTGVIPSRPDDAFGIAGAYVAISPGARGFDRDTAFFSGMPTPIRTVEATVEATYNYQIVPGFTVQPNAQYVLRPSGGVVDPGDPAKLRRIHNAAIFGLRSTIRF